MFEPAQSPCFASHTANLTFELSSTTLLNPNMLFSNQDNIDSQSISQNKGIEKHPENINPLNIVPPSSQIISSVSTSASSSASSSSKGTKNIQPSTKKYKVKINSGKGTIPGDFFNQNNDNGQAGRAMTAVIKERQFNKLDSMHTMSYIAETTESAEVTLEDPNIEFKKTNSTHLKSNNSKGINNNNNNSNNNSNPSASKNKPINGQIVYSKLSASKKDNLGSGSCQNGDGSQLQKKSINRESIGNKIWVPVLSQNDNLLQREDTTGLSTAATNGLLSSSQIFQIQDTPKFSSVPDGQDSQFFPIKNLNFNNSNGITNNNNTQLSNLNLESKESLSSLQKINKNTSDISSNSSQNFNNQSQAAPCISQGQSEVHMSFCDSSLQENNNNNNEQSLLVSHNLNQQQSTTTQKSSTFDKNIQNPSNIIDLDLQDLQQKQVQSPPLNNNLLLAPQLQQKRCSSMETDGVFNLKELSLISSTKERKQNNIGPNNSHEESDSQNKYTNMFNKKREVNYSEEKTPKSQIVYSQTFKNSGKQQQQQIIPLQPQQQNQEQQSFLQKPSSIQGQSKTPEGFIQKISFTNKSQPTNKPCSSAHQYPENQNTHLSPEAQALKQVQKQQSLVKQKNLIAKLINQQHLPSQKSQSTQDNQPKQLLKQESVPNLQITTTSASEEFQQFPTKYYLGTNQQRSSSTGQIVTSSFSSSMKSSSYKQSEHKKTGSMIDLSVGDALTNIVLAQKPVRVVASSSSKRIRDSKAQSPSSKQPIQPQRKSFEITFLNPPQPIISTKPQSDRSDSFLNLMNKVKNEQKTIEQLETQQSSQKLKYQSFLKNHNSSSQIKKSKWLSENTACFYNLSGGLVSPDKPALSERLLTSQDQNSSSQILQKGHQNTNISSSIGNPGIQWNALNNSEDISAVGNTYFHMRSGSKNQIALANYCQNSMGTNHGLPRIVANQQSGNKANFRNNLTVTDRLNQNSMSQYMQNSQQQIQNSQMSYLDHVNTSTAMKQLQQQPTSGMKILSPERTTTSRENNNNRKSISIMKSPKPLQTVLSKLIFPERERATASHLASCISYRTPRQTYLNTQ